MTAVLFDTSVAVPLRDGDTTIWTRAQSLDTAPYISVLTAAELEAGVHADPAQSAMRRASLDALYGALEIIPFDDAELAAYRALLAVLGFNRSKILDRLIAATALAHGLRLATRNPKDFRDVPDLAVEEW